jgi:hypothetical protein
MKAINFSVLTAFAISAAVSTLTISVPAQASRTRQPAAEGICSGYISPSSKPDSFEYREGLYRCLYGTD